MIKSLVLQKQLHLNKTNKKKKRKNQKDTLPKEKSNAKKHVSDVPDGMY